MSKIWPLRKSASTDEICYKRRFTWSSTPQYERLTGESNKGYGIGLEDRDHFSQCKCLPEKSYVCSNCANSQKTQFSNNDRDLGSERYPRSLSRGTKLSITVLDSGEHCHDDEAQRAIDKRARKKLWIASLLCVIFMIVEAIGGILAGSLAVATDAAHLLTDFAGFMISLFALYISERPATKRLSYGYHRAEVIGALTSVLLIWVVTGILIYMAIQRIVSQDFEIDAAIMLITSGIGLIVNIVMGCTLHQHAHSHGGGGQGHGHGHSHGGNTSKEHSKKSVIKKDSHKVDIDNDNEHSAEHHIDQSGGDEDHSDTSSSSGVQERNQKENINVRAAFIHVIGDFLQSVGVFIAALVIYFKPEWAIVDPICTFLFSILVLATTYAIVTDTLVVLMEGIPKGIDFNDVRATLLTVKGVQKVHNLRIWSLSMDRIALSAHLAIDANAKHNGNQILKKSSQKLKIKYGFSEVTIQIEDFSEKMQDCVKCQELN